MTNEVAGELSTRERAKNPRRLPSLFWETAMLYSPAS